MLSDRRQIVLRALIEEYIARALPVGSRTLVERYNLRIPTVTEQGQGAFHIRGCQTTILFQ